MSYQSIQIGITERFFTVVNRINGLSVTTGTVNYFVLAKSGPNDGKWWRDSDQTWQSVETANVMKHEADGHWEIDLVVSPFATEGVRFLEYVKESTNLHVPDSRHLIANLDCNTIPPDNAGISQILDEVQASECDTDAIVAATVAALANVELRPERTVLGPCEQTTIELEPAQVLRPIKQEVVAVPTVLN